MWLDVTNVLMTEIEVWDTLRVTGGIQLFHLYHIIIIWMDCFVLNLKISV